MVLRSILHGCRQLEAMVAAGIDTYHLGDDTANVLDALYTAHTTLDGMSSAISGYSAFMQTVHTFLATKLAQQLGSTDAWLGSLANLCKKPPNPTTASDHAAWLSMVRSIVGKNITKVTRFPAVDTEAILIEGQMVELWFAKTDDQLRALSVSDGVDAHVVLAQALRWHSPVLFTRHITVLHASLHQYGVQTLHELAKSAIRTFCVGHGELGMC